MITSILLSLREGLEAALVIGIVIGALRRTGRSDLVRYIWAGVVTAFVVSLVTALGLRAIDKELEGKAEQIYEGVTFMVAAGVITWMILWIRRQSGGMKAQIEKQIKQATNSGGRSAIYLLAFVAVVREGIELSLYLTAVSLSSTSMQTLLGTAFGLSTACLLGYLIYTTTIRLPLGKFFQVTGVILVLFAAGLLAHGVAEFNETGLIPAIISPIWNLNPFLNDQSILGTILSTLFGYHGTPSLTEAVGYAGYILLAVLFLIKPKGFQTRKLILRG